MSFITVPPGSPSPALQPLYELEPAPEAAPRRRQLGNAVYRQRWLGLALLIFFVALGASASWWVRPYYKATATLVIQHPSLHPAEITPQEYPPPVDADREMQTELTIFQSRAVALPVVRALDLERRDPEIAQALAAARRDLAKKHKTLSPSGAEAVAVGVFRSKLEAAPDKLSSTVTVSYASHDPNVATAAINAAVQSFLHQTLARRGAAGEEAAHWMKAQVAEAEATLSADDAAVNAFQRSTGYIPLAPGGGGADAAGSSGLLARLADANHTLAAAQAQRIADQAAAESYAGAAVGELPADLRGPAIDRAAENVGASQAQLATLAATYQPGFPLVTAARQQLSTAETQLASLRAQVADGLKERVAASRAREQASAATVAELNAEAARSSSEGLRFAALRSRADAQRGLVGTLQQKLAEVELGASLPPSNIQVLDAAQTPGLPEYPRLPLDLGLGLGLGLVAAAGAMLGREHWTQALTAPEAVKRGLGPALAPLGMVAETAGLRPGTHPLLPPVGGTGAEGDIGWGKIAANLVARAGAPPRALLVTSASPGEGRTTAVCRLGMALAAAGWRTLLVDANLGRPGCHAFFGLPNGHGLSAALSGRKVAPLSVAPHLDLLPGEEAAAQPLQARAMAALLEQWREHYDYILLDAPAANQGGGAVLLSSLVEGVVLALRWGHTRLPEAQRAAEELARAHAPLVGSLFCRADERAPAFRAWRGVAPAPVIGA